MAAPRDLAGEFLCRDCDQLFSRNGENWVLKRICKDGRFPLLDRLRVAMPIGESDDSLAFSGPDAGFQMEKLAYFVIICTNLLSQHSAHQPLPVEKQFPHSDF